MILIHLDEATRDELRSLHRQELLPRARDRLEMVMLSSVAWAPARIAAHLGYCTATVRTTLKDRPQRTPGPPLPGHARGWLTPDHQLAAAQARPGRGRPGREGVGQREKKASAGCLKLDYLDECGFSPTGIRERLDQSARSRRWPCGWRTQRLMVAGLTSKSRATCCCDRPRRTA
jgi:hypothetical protein